MAIRQIISRSIKDGEIADADTSASFSSGSSSQRFDVDAGKRYTDGEVAQWKTKEYWWLVLGPELEVSTPS